MLTFRTLCSGGELFGIGAVQAGYQHLDGYEIEPRIADVARLNHFDVRVADVCAVDFESLALADHLHGSPSCKNASQANVKAGEAPEDLAVADAFCRAIRAHQGRTFSLENVWGYRNFESFARILSALHGAGFTVEYRHINAADYGVPQTRKRLILRAVRGGRVPPLHPTHRKGGDMFHLPWTGWYAAIEDLLDTLPPTEPAPWQLARMPKELRETLLFANNDSQDQHGNSYGATSRATDEPALTISTMTAGWWKALLMGDQSAGAGIGVQIADASAPAFTLRASDHNAPPRAYLCGGGNTQLAQVDSHARDAGEPAFTVRDGANGSPERAFLLDGDNARADTGKSTIRSGDEPAMAMRGTRTPTHRAYVGRWARMTIRALGRFQTVPDSYIGLTPTINGNGVPCLLSQSIMESLRGVYE